MRLKFWVLTVIVILTASSVTHAVTLRWAAQNDILTLDPHSQNHATTISLLQHCYEPLVRYDEKFQTEPALATSWQQVSSTQWRFNLRRNVRFHDGSPFTADDVLFSFDRIRQPQGTMQPYVAGVREVRKVDDYTVDFILDGPNPVFLRNLVVFHIMSKTWAVKNKAEKIQDYKANESTYASRNANGTGAYMIKAWEPDTRVLLAANPDWWDKRPGNVTEVIYLPIKSEATRVAALLSGEVDLLTDVPTQDVARLRQDPRLKIIDGAENRTIFIALDQGSAELKYSDVKGRNPFKDVRVRHALNMAVDRDAIKRVTMRGLSIPAAIMIAPNVHGYSEELDRVAPADPDGAKKLLAEAGYPNGLEFQLNCPNNRYVNDEAICRALVTMWARIGVRASLVTESMATFIAKVQNFDTSAYMLGWGVQTFDALYMLQAIPRTRTSGADGSFNFARLSDPSLDQLIDAAKTEMDPTKRDALLHDALQLVRDQYYFVPLHYQLRPWVMKKNISTTYRANDQPESRFARVD